MSPLRKVLKPLNPPDKSGQALKGTFAKSLIIGNSPFRGPGGIKDAMSKISLFGLDLRLNHYQPANAKASTMAGGNS